MQISLRSRLLIIVGKLFYGDPKAFGLNCTSEEMYCLPNERSKLNTGIEPLHPSNVDKPAIQRRNVLINEVRIKIFNHMAISAFVASAIVFAGGSAITAGVVKTKSVVSSAKEKYNNKDNINKRLEEITNEAKEITAKAKAGQMSKDDYEIRKTQLQQEFKSLKDRL